MKRRQDSAGHPTQRGNGDGECGHAPIDANVVRDVETRHRRQPFEQAKADPRGGERDDGRARGNDQALGEQQADNTLAFRAERQREAQFRVSGSPLAKAPSHQRCCTRSGE